MNLASQQLDPYGERAQRQLQWTQRSMYRSCNAWFARASRTCRWEPSHRSVWPLAASIDLSHLVTFTNLDRSIQNQCVPLYSLPDRNIWVHEWISSLFICARPVNPSQWCSTPQRCHVSVLLPKGAWTEPMISFSWRILAEPLGMISFFFFVNQE